MKKVKARKIIIGQAVNQEITLPVLEIGNGLPKLGVIGGIHGNEPESLFVIKQLFKKLEKEDFQGTVKLLPGANPFGLVNNIRQGGFDFLDLNRSFPGEKDGTLTERIARAIFDEFSDCEVVIDIHSITNEGSFMGMELEGEGSEFLEKTRNINRFLDPPVIWRAIEGKKYDSALDKALLKVGICGMGVEVPRLEFLTDEIVEKITNGMCKAIKTQGKAPKLKKPIPVLGNAKRYFSDKGGIYTPSMKLMSPVKQGDCVGVITLLAGLNDFPLESKWSGVLFVQSTRKVVKTGDKVYVVAEKLGEFQ